jgi:phosphoglucosamine mutase
MNKISNIFTNSSIREKIEHELLQPPAITNIGYAIGLLLADEFEDEACNILIATDTRPSGQTIKSHLIQALQQTGNHVFDAGICPTPIVAKTLQDSEDFALGIVITASHNSAEFNGIKILTPFGYLDIETEQEISQYFAQLRTITSKERAEFLPEHTGAVQPIDLVADYAEALSEFFSNRKKNITVLLDCSNGATATIAPKLFESLGYRIKTINATQQGTLINKNSGCSNPKQLLQTLNDAQTDWACAFDGDGDRVIIAHKSGAIFDGDDIVALLSTHQRYQNNQIVVGTILTNSSLEQFLMLSNKKLIRAQVGERNVIEMMSRHQALLGAETCGHVLMLDHALCSDGIFVALQFLEMIQDKKFDDIARMHKHHQTHHTIDLPDKKLDSAQQTNIKNLTEHYQKNHDCRIVIRPSNTEPVLRILVESTDEQTAILIMKNIIEDLACHLRSNEQEGKLFHSSSLQMRGSLSSKFKN